LGLARDPRVIGVALRQIALRNGTSCRVIGSADAVLTEGFHPFEPGDSLRWTEDDAALPVALFHGFDGPLELLLHLGSTTRYPLLGKVASCVAA
jgi:hypothetical protein